jgi:hypothetical protein
MEIVAFDNEAFYELHAERPLSSLAREFLSLLRASVTKELPASPTPPRTRHKASTGGTREFLIGPKLLSWIFSITSLSWISWMVA